MAATPPEPKKVSDITSTLLRPALTSHFLVHFALPSILAKPNAVAQDKIYLECSDASLPGSSLATFDINNDFHGVTERRAYRRMFDDRIDLTFYVDAENYSTIRLFEDWIGGIMNGNKEQEIKNPNYYYTTLYPKEYRTPLSIVKFERDYSSQLKYNFVDAYPVSIGSMPISYEGSNLLKCTVGFTYLRYYIEKPKAEEPQEQPTANPEVNSLLDNLPPPPPPPLPPLPPPPPPPKPFDIRDRDIRARANFDGRFDPI
tara:strand:- start:62 stop:835 length:774 start_codon:yes stop_codon:yes gene_type:complete